MKVYVALGSNLGVPSEHLSVAIAKIESHQAISNLTVSPWYSSVAIGGPDNQPDYINAACKFDCQIPPKQLLLWLQQIEVESGRVRDVRWGPRTLDLDIIWCNGFQSSEPRLTVPHPRAHERAFVLRPLQDLEADFLLQSHTISYWLDITKDQVIEPLNKSP